MAETKLVKTSWTGPYPQAGTALTLAGDTTNSNYFVMSGNDLVVAVGVGGTGTATLVGVDNVRGRAESVVSPTIADEEVYVLGPLRDLDGFRGPLGCKLTPSSANVKFGVVTLRG